ncbi:MAG: hypothetical protein OK422_00970 [Thaumarchaeota archaeon]|nr:hypothetical protein [Nitrososphaerota archaeon]
MFNILDGYDVKDDEQRRFEVIEKTIRKKIAKAEKEENSRHSKGRLHIIDEVVAALSELGKKKGFLSEEGKIIKADISKLSERFANAEAHEARLARQRLEALREETERRRLEIDQLEEANRINHVSLLDFQKEHDRLRELHEQLTLYDTALRRKTDLETELNFAEREVRTFEGQVSSLENQIGAYTKDLENYAELVAVEAALEPLKGKRDSIRDVETKILDAKQRQKDLTKEISLLMTELHGLDAQTLQRLRRSKNRVRPFAAGTIASFILAFISYVAGFLTLAVVFAVAGAFSAAFLANAISGISKLGSLERFASKSDLLDSRNRDLQTTEASLEQSNSQKSSIENEIFAICRGVTRYSSIFNISRGAMALVEAMTARAQSERREADTLNIGIQTLKKQIELTGETFDASSHDMRINELKEQLNDVVLPALPPSTEFSSELFQNVIRERELVAQNIGKAKAEIESNKKRIKEDGLYLQAHSDVEDRVKDQQKRVQEVEHRIAVVKSAIEVTDSASDTLQP